MSILDPGVRPGQVGGDTAKLKLTANIVFSGECEGLDVDAAAAELRQAGYDYGTTLPPVRAVERSEDRRQVHRHDGRSATKFA
jgi:hypothetical protein